VLKRYLIQIKDTVKREIVKERTNWKKSRKKKFRNKKSRKKKSRNKKSKIKNAKNKFQHSGNISSYL